MFSFDITDILCVDLAHAQETDFKEVTKQGFLSSGLAVVPVDVTGVSVAGPVILQVGR